MSDERETPLKVEWAYDPAKAPTEEVWKDSGFVVRMEPMYDLTGFNSDHRPLMDALNRQMKTVLNRIAKPWEFDDEGNFPTIEPFPRVFAARDRVARKLERVRWWVQSGADGLDRSLGRLQRWVDPVSRPKWWYEPDGADD